MHWTWEAIGTLLLHCSGYLHSVNWSAGVLEWSTGMESLEWSEALEWACDHFWESCRYFFYNKTSLIGEYEEGLKTLACMDTFVNQNTW